MNIADSIFGFDFDFLTCLIADVDWSQATHVRIQVGACKGCVIADHTLVHWVSGEWLVCHCSVYSCLRLSVLEVRFRLLRLRIVEKTSSTRACLLRWNRPELWCADIVSWGVVWTCNWSTDLISCAIPLAWPVLLILCSIVFWDALASSFKGWSVRTSIMTIELCLSRDWIELISVLTWVHHEWVHVGLLLLDRVPKESGWHRLVSRFLTELLLTRIHVSPPADIFGDHPLSDFLFFPFLVEFFQAVSAHSHSLIVCELRHLDEVFGALRAYNGATLATVVLSFEESEFDFTDETRLSLITSPIGPLGNFDVFDPSLVRILSKMSLCARHTRKAHHIVLIFGDSLGHS